MSYYNDYKDFSEDYFEGGLEHGYKNYDRSSYNAEWVDVVDKNFDTGAVLVVGCAHGYAVEFLRGLGWDAYGMDISEHAISNSPVKEYLIQGDALDESDWKDALDFAGVDSFDVVFTEHLISHFDDEAVENINDLCRVYGENVVHRMFGNSSDAFNSNPVSYWIDKIGSFEDVYWVDTDNEEDGIVG